MKPLFSSADKDSLAKILNKMLGRMVDEEAEREILQGIDKEVIDSRRDQDILAYYQRVCVEIDLFAANMEHGYNAREVMADIRNIMRQHVLEGRGNYETLMYMDADVEWTAGSPLLDEIMEFVTTAVPPNWRPEIVRGPFKILMMKEIDCRLPGELTWRKEYVLSVSWLTERYYYRNNPRVFKAILHNAVADAHAFVLTAELLALCLRQDYRAPKVLTNATVVEAYPEVKDIFYDINDYANAHMQYVVVADARLEHYVEDATTTLEINGIERPLDWDTQPVPRTTFYRTRFDPRNPT